jgi:uncharacterized protein YycO
MTALFFNFVSMISFFISKIHLPWSTLKIKANGYRSILERISNGDILLSYTEGELSNVFIPGQWSHTAMFLDSEWIPGVIEATSEGVIHTDIIDFCLSKDKICLLRPTFLSESEKSECLKRGVRQLGKPYDYAMRSDTKAFYCSELIWYCINNDKFTMRKRLGQLTVVPDDFYKARTKFEVICEISK